MRHRATLQHYATRHGGAATCGRRAMRVTMDTAGVDCESCRKTEAFRAGLRRLAKRQADAAVARRSTADALAAADNLDEHLERGKAVHNAVFESMAEPTLDEEIAEAREALAHMDPMDELHEGPAHIIESERHLAALLRRWADERPAGVGVADVVGVLSQGHEGHRSAEVGGTDLCGVCDTPWPCPPEIARREIVALRAEAHVRDLLAGAKAVGDPPEEATLSEFDNRW